MPTPAQTGFAQGLVNSLAPWINGASPSALDTRFGQFGGFQGLLDAMMQDSPGSQGAAAYGRALEGVQNDALQRAAARQQLASQNIGLQKQAMMLPILQAYYGAAIGGQAPGGSSNPPGAASALPSGFGSPAPPNGAQSTYAASPTQGAASAASSPGASGAAPSPFTAPTPGSIASIPVGGMSPQMLRLGGLIGGQSPLATAQQIRQQQIAIAQQRFAPVLAQLDTLTKSQTPTQYIRANPQLMAAWNQTAPTLGFDPVKGFTDANARTAFSFLRNHIAGALTLPTVAPPVQMATVPGPLNSLYSRNPVTNALSQIRPEESLKPVVSPNGNIRYVPASQAAGQTPFNATTYIDRQTTEGVAKLIASYDYPADRLAYAMRTPQGQAIMAEVRKLNPNFDASTYNVKQRAREAFATGTQGNTVRSLSVATSHLDMLSDAAHALSQHDLPAFNKLVNAFGVHITGANSQTNFDAMRAIVGDEVVKSIIGTGGAEGDREEIKSAFQAARSPEQIQGVINKYEALLGGQLRGLRRQYQQATGLHDFNSFVDTMAQQQLNSAANQALGAQPQPLGVGQSRSVGGFTVTRVK